jgi:hypothetical protein
MILRTGAIARGGELLFASRDELTAYLLGAPADTPFEEQLVLMRSALQQMHREDDARGWVRLAAEMGIAREVPPEPMGLPDVPQAADATREAKKLFVLGISQRDALVAKVQCWINDGGGYEVRPNWSGGAGDRPEWQSGVRSLYAAIGVALWDKIQDGRGSRPCRHCRRIFPVKRVDQWYCDREACRRARLRENTRQHRAKPPADHAPR